MTDFLLELRSEEIPARMQVKAKADLSRLLAAEIGKAGLVAASIETFATPRRLALIARRLLDATEAVSEEIKGPKASAPPQALEGFLRKTGLSRKQLVERDGVFFAVIDKPGRATSEVLADAIPAIVRAFPWPKSMRWGGASHSTESLRWVRPLQGIVALFGQDVVPCEVDGIESGAATTGHRFHHSGAITIGSADDYVEKLRAAHVLVHFSERCALIRDGAARLAGAAGLSVIEDEALVIENAGLTEWPVPLLGSFDPAFLDVPPEVIQLTARVNQKYFVLRDAAGKLAPNFICTANIDASDGGAAIVAGNERVLSARLADAKFFWENDLKVPLEDQAAKLSQIVFHEKLGTVADKVERVSKLARWLCAEGIVQPSLRSGEGGERSEPGEVSAPPLADSPLLTASRSSSPLRREDLATLATRAARLCKADLVTGMVGEFPELQGVIGGYLAAAQGEDPQVAAAIRDHYKPVGQGDDVPTDPVTVAVSLADKLDTIYCFFARGMKPTGSKDPFALRRAAIGVIEILHFGRLRLPLSDSVLQLTMSRAIQLFNAAERIDHKAAEFAEGLTDSDGKESYVAEKLAIVERVNEQHGLKVALAFDEQAMLFLYEGVVMIHRRKRYAGEILDFFADRLKAQQREAGIRHDLIDAVFALGGEDDLVRLLARVKALQAFVGTDEGANLLAGYKRAANILKKEGFSPSPLAGEGRLGNAERGEGDKGNPFDGSLDPLTPLGLRAESPSPAGEEGKSEATLAAALDAAEPTAQAAIASEDFAAAMFALASLRAPIDAFFEGVMVNDPDPAVRAFRLGLLARFRDAVHSVADFSKIEG